MTQQNNEILPDKGRNERNSINDCGGGRYSKKYTNYYIFRNLASVMVDLLSY